jgi:hypothetical protein
MDNFDLKRFLVENKMTRNSKLLNENINIDEQGNLVYSLEDADVDYSDSSEILLTWEIDDVNPKLIRKFEWDDTEDTIHTYIDVDELKDFIKNPVELTKKFEAPNGYVVVDKQDARDLMESYYENFEDEIDPELNENQISQESYTYDEPSLLDFVKKNIGDIEMEITGHFHDTYPPVYSSDDVYEIEDIVFIKGKKYGPPVAIINRTPTQKDLELTGTDRNDWREGFDRELIPGKDPKYITSYRRKNRYMHAYITKEPPLKNASNTSQSKNIYSNPYFGNTTTTFDKLKENKMDNFNLKKFLVENKMTRNSILLNEQPEPDGIPADDPLAQIPAVPAETPAEPSGEIDKETAKELIFGTKGKFFTVKFIKLDGSERVMNARLGVKKYLKGGTLKYNPEDFNYITVYDMGAKGYRTVNANTIQNLKIGNNEYVIPTAVSESQLDENAKPEDIGKGTRLFFKDDKTTYYAKNVASDKKNVFVTKDNDDRVYKKSIAKIIQINNKKF